MHGDRRISGLALALVFAGILCLSGGSAFAQSCYGVNANTLRLSEGEMARYCGGSFNPDKCYESARFIVSYARSGALCPNVDPGYLQELVAQARQNMTAARRNSPGVVQRNTEAIRENNRPRGGGGGFYAPAPAQQPTYQPPVSPSYTPPRYTCPPGYLVNGHQCY